MVGSLGLQEVIVHVDVVNVEDTYEWYVSEARIFYMFYVGLDADLSALWNDSRRCGAPRLTPCSRNALVS